MPGSGKTPGTAGSEKVLGTTGPVRALQIYRVLHETYPDAGCELDFRNPFELLIATVLSAQSTDKGVNKVTPILFQRYPSPEALAGAELEDVEQIIRSTGFFHNKASALLGIGQSLVENFAGQVPTGLDELTSLPGVGRKTAHVVRGHAFGLPAITTDTHVIRLSNRLGFVATKVPLKVEQALCALFDPELWTSVSDTLIVHGRRRCNAKKPACGACPVAVLCPSFGTGPIDPDEARRLVKSS
ncbi:endonuclease III [Propionibacterium sp.]|uniref:endonuclease III n=1 Tax=Propionibacterium sp. TaxID=1977903 RepID=UPI0039EB0E43